MTNTTLNISANTPFLISVPNSQITREWYRVLNAIIQQLQVGVSWGSPGAIGIVIPNAGSFTTLFVSGLDTRTSSGDQFKISKDQSPFRRGSWATLNSGSLYTLLSDFAMEYWTHNIALDANGNFLGRDEAGPVTFWAFTESGLEKTFNAPFGAQGNIPPIWTLTRNFNTGTGDVVYLGTVTAGNFATTGTAAVRGQDTDFRYGAAMPLFSCSQAGNLLTATLSAPFKMDFRNVDLTSGSNIELSQSNNLSLAMTSTLGSLGATTAVATRLIWALVYAAGSPQIAVSNISGGLQIDETNLITTSAIGAGSTSATAWYSTTAITTPSQYRIIGFTDATWTNGTGWGSPTTVQPVGVGQALANSSLGYGQTWQDVKASRAYNNTYYNTTGKPIEVSVGEGNGSTTIAGVVNGLTVTISPGNGVGSATVAPWIYFTVPPGQSYSVLTAGVVSLNLWRELR